MSARRPPRTVLITGANGIVGSALLEFLADRFTLIPMTRRAAGLAGRVGDITSLDDVVAACEGVDAIVHLAAAATVDAPWDDVLAANVIGTYNVYEAARRNGVALVVYASSNHVIGMHEIENAPALYDLDDPRVFDSHTEIRPDSLYGASKVFGEALGRYHVDRHGLRVICLRIGSVLRDDDPRSDAVAAGPSWMRLTREQSLARLRATWLSRRDCAELVARCLESVDVRWACVYGISANARQFWDLTGARDLLGFVPRDGTDP
jgi:nucleoside-diphosphate-sugar epimerase